MLRVPLTCPSPVELVEELLDTVPRANWADDTGMRGRAQRPTADAVTSGHRDAMGRARGGRAT